MKKTTLYVKALIYVAVVATVFLFVLGESPPGAYAFWLWTPQTGKWVNPKYAAKDTPEEQFEFAKGFYEAGEHKKAIDEFNKLIKRYPQSKSAPEAQYYIGRSWENLEEYYRAFLAYQEVIDKYPTSDRVTEIAEYQYRIGNLFYGGTKRKLIGMALLPAFDKALEIYRKVAENAPYGEYGSLAQYKVGTVLMKMRKFQDARKEFEKFLNEYPESELADDAIYQIALCSFESSLDSDYDQQSTDKALEELEDLMSKHPNAEISDEAREVINKLKEKKAEKAYCIAQFYERQGSMESAEIYYNEVVDDYQETSWAAKALERLQIIKKGRK